MTKKAHIHHRNGDPANNPPDGSNWEVLCYKCHKKLPVNKNRPGRNGVFVVALFTPWKRAEIIKSRGYRCERCGGELSLRRLSNKPRPQCIACGRIIERKSDGIQWKGGSIMCAECFERNY